MDSSRRSRPLHSRGYDYEAPPNFTNVRDFCGDFGHRLLMELVQPTDLEGIPGEEGGGPIE
uniref:Uncharacterized protein n=1 Tax=Pristionchus pacificus TaxID=54126 RepID=A0A2A6CBW3_PRIPA|eukprot:PDM75702.1 hypothetical protein PRIPAC_40081 [Pristionchus pacificus]